MNRTVFSMLMLGLFSQTIKDNTDMNRTVIVLIHKLQNKDNTDLNKIVFVILTLGLFSHKTKDNTNVNRTIIVLLHKLQNKHNTDWNKIVFVMLPLGRETCKLDVRKKLPQGQMTFSVVGYMCLIYL